MIMTRKRKHVKKTVVRCAGPNVVWWGGSGGEYGKKGRKRRKFISQTTTKIEGGRGGRRQVKKNRRKPAPTTKNEERRHRALRNDVTILVNGECKTIIPTLHKGDGGGPGTVSIPLGLLGIEKEGRGENVSWYSS